MLNYLKNKGKKVLVTIDEVDNSEAMRLFIQSYASLLGQDLPMRLLMTGLYSNVSKLQNDKALTFLFRAPKIQIGPLSIIAIANKYSEIFKIELGKAIEFAKLTKGYAYAYQVLGYILFEQKKKEVDLSVLSLFDQRMEEFVYGKVYSEISSTSKFVLKQIKKDEPIKLSELSKLTGKNAKSLSVYRDQLIKEGILVAPSYGYIQFVLPIFEIFLMMK